MSIEVYFDFVCPWCYIGHRKLEKARAALPSAHRPSVVWRSYQLDPDAGVVPTRTAAEAMRGWYPNAEEAEARMARIVSLGRDEGLHIDLERALPVNTFDAHRISHLAMTLGLVGPLNELMFCAYHADGLNIADHEILVAIASQAGMNSEEVKDLLSTERFSDAFHTDISRASRERVKGVPTLIGRDGQRASAVQEHSELTALLDTRKGAVE